ncbi:ABC transporter permease [Rhodococcus globerulus]|uniref:ABC transporter permease n=1 Tax=Rhodococcus globerulus TaxID=33008 RepID=UPI001FD2BE6B|nr:ABC transporter permease [Rhodococcus globerulus]
MKTWNFTQRAGSLFQFLMLLFMVSVAVFLLLELIPGDPVDALLPPDASPEQITAARDAYGLNDPLLQRYFSWMGAVLHGDFGRSYQTGVSVGESIMERLPVSLELALVSIILALVIAIPTAVWSAYRPGGIVDRVTTIISSAMLATPSFVLGIVLIFVFAMTLNIFPPMGWVPFSEDPIAHIEKLILPVVTLAASEIVLFIRILKGDMMTTLQQDHVLSARARGLPTWRILSGHALKQSSFSLVTVSGMVIGRLIGGTILVEAIFSLPGLGTLAINGIHSRDYVVVQAVVLVCAVGYILINALVDLTYPLLDPRVRKERTS